MSREISADGFIHSTRSQVHWSDLACGPPVIERPLSFRTDQGQRSDEIAMGGWKKIPAFTQNYGCFILHHVLRDRADGAAHWRPLKLIFMQNLHRKVCVLNHRGGQTLQLNTKQARISLFLTSLSLHCSRLWRMSPRWRHLDNAPGNGSCTPSTLGHQPGRSRGTSCFNFNAVLYPARFGKMNDFLRLLL